MPALDPVLWDAPMNIALPGIATGFVALLFTVVLQSQIKGQKVGKDIGKPVLDELADQVRSGSMAFLQIEYKYLAGFVGALAVILVLLFTAQPISNDRTADRGATD